MKYTTPVLLALLFVLIAPATYALVDANLQRYDPTPAQPGDLLTVYISVSNNEDTAARDVQLEILDTSTVTPEGRSVLNAGTINAYSSYLATAQVRIAKDAPAGEVVLRMRVREGSGNWQEQTATITVQSAQSAAIISNVQIQPEAVNPGREASVTLTVENNADSLLRDVTTELDLQDTPFVPTGSSTRKKISSLAAGQQAQVTYQLVAQPSATADIYRIPVTISFLNEQGERREDQDAIGVYVITETQTQAIVDSVTRNTDGIEVAVRLINKGLSEIKFAQATIQEADGYEIPVNQQQTYLGNIDSDDWETMRFNIQTDQEQVSIPLRYTYQDAFNNELEQETTLQVDIPPAQTQGVSISTILLVLVVIAAAGYYIKKRRNNKK